MRSNALWTIVPVSLFLLTTKPAAAHFHLDEPPSSTVQAANGDPQKPANLTDQCPNGTVTGMVTKVRAGGQLKVKITETIGHVGHYRVAFGANEAAFTFPTTTAVAGQCMDAQIQSPAVMPVLSDGLFVHNSATGNFCNGTATCETMVTIPGSTAPGMYTLQVLEWMRNAGAGGANGNDIWDCYYSHCAAVEVVEADASIPDGGVVVGDAGSSSGNPQSDGGDDDDDPNDPSGSSSGSGRRRSSTPSDSGGCDVSSANGASLCAPLLGALAAIRVLRRRRSPTK
jgi:hypothetical protein